MAVLFTADTHFGHGGALGLYRRPFASVVAMDAAMTALWNETVAPDDEVWHLGDFALGRTAAQMGPSLDALNGRKHLVAGNNDGAATLSLPGWASVQPYAELRHEGKLLVLCHYAFRTWRDMARGAINLHGHSHGRLSPMPRQFDVGVDTRGFRPVGLAGLIA
jgi:calcineurin-like phosphoesterase family protein